MTFTLNNPAKAIAAAVLILCAGALVGLWATRGNAADTPGATAPAVQAKPALSVTTTRPVLGRLPVQLIANGNIAAWQEASIGAEANGLRLQDIRAAIGDTVRAGQVLATFSDAPIQADLALARANLLEAQANALEASGNATRARSLKDTGALSAQQINQYLTQEQTAQARVQAARAALDVQQLRLRQTQVLAPDRGVISARSATVGAVVPSGTELFRMVRQGRLEWRAEVTASELGLIRAGTVAQVTLPGGVQIKGRVRMVAPTVDSQSRVALVYVDLVASADLAAPPRAGMFASGSFLLGDTSSLTVPQSALVMRDGFTYVYRLDDNNRVARLKVQTGRQAGEQTEITSALDANTRLVATGAGFLNDGDLVRVVDRNTASPAPAKPQAAASASR